MAKDLNSLLENRILLLRKLPAQLKNPIIAMKFYVAFYTFFD